jgi:hypothetical protein
MSVNQQARRNRRAFQTHDDSEGQRMQDFRKIKNNGGHVSRSQRVRFIAENAADTSDYEEYDDTDNFESVMVNG